VKIVLATADSNLQLSLGLSLSEEPSVTIVGVTSEAESLLALIKFTRPNIVVADWDLPGRPLAELLDEAHTNGGKPKWIVLGPSTMAREQALQAGAAAFVVRGDPPEALLNAFRDTRAMLAAHANEQTVTTKEE
jgi:DNA-binding NarL/FixJ family response regulator